MQQLEDRQQDQRRPAQAAIVRRLARGRERRALRRHTEDDRARRVAGAERGVSAHVRDAADERVGGDGRTHSDARAVAEEDTIADAHRR